MSSDLPSMSSLPPPRTLSELKAETLRRAERSAYPLIGIDPQDVREALGAIDSLDPDEWGRGWMRVGDRYAAEGERLLGTDADEADRNFLRAWRIYGFGRWPVPNAPAKAECYARSIAVFARHTELLDVPLEVIRLPFEGSEIVAYLQLPKDVRPAPVVLAISGLDSRKEDLAERFAWLLPFGIGYVAVDAPGTGQAPLKASATAERMYSELMNHIVRRPEVDARKVAVFGGSFGGYWATKFAILERERLAGAVVQSPGVHAAYQLPHLRKSLANTEYLFDLVPAMMTTFEGVSNLDDLAAARASLSLVTQGLLERETPPMLVIAGARDTQSPIEDIELLLRNGATPKEAWINPRGGHMGRDAFGLNDVAIFKQVTMPWLVRRLRSAQH